MLCAPPSPCQCYWRCCQCPASLSTALCCSCSTELGELAKDKHQHCSHMQAVSCSQCLSLVQHVHSIWRVSISFGCCSAQLWFSPPLMSLQTSRCSWHTACCSEHRGVGGALAFPHALFFTSCKLPCLEAQVGRGYSSACSAGHRIGR